MRATVAIGLSCLGVALAVSGCATTPPPIYERRMQIRDIAADVGPVEDAHQLLSPEETVGRFSCSLAIAKLVAADQAGTVNLVELTPAEEAYWIEAVRGVMELRDLQFLTSISVRPEEPRTDTLCAAADALETSLLLLYAPNRHGPNSAQVLGVLYDVKTRKPIASLQASATFLNEKGEEIAPDDERGDHREIDAYFQASRAYEHHLLECLSELIRDDSSLPGTQPHQWTTPLEERWWLW
jgi:hypothetical protein